MLLEGSVLKKILVHMYSKRNIDQSYLHWNIFRMEYLRDLILDMILSTQISCGQVKEKKKRAGRISLFPLNI